MEPHRVLIFANSGPSGPEGIAEVTQILRAGTSAELFRRDPRKRGPGYGEYEREALILSRPRRSFGFFPIAGKETRPAGRNPVRRRAESSRPTKRRKQHSPSAGGEIFPTYNNPLRNLPPHPAPSGPPSPQGEGLEKADGEISLRPSIYQSLIQI